MTTTAERTFTEQFVEAGGIRTQLRKGGRGDPLLILHSELGVPGWIGAYEQLAAHYTVYVPSLPGFGESESAEWIASVRDLAAWVTWFARDLKLPEPLNVVGFSMGGWVAAEIATVNASIFEKMVLVGAAGLKPGGGPDLGLLRQLGQAGLRAGVPRPRPVPGIRQVLRARMDAGGGGAGRDQPGDGGAAALEAVPAEQDAGRSPRRHRGRRR